MLYYIVDVYTIEDVASTKRLAEEKLDALSSETGLFIWHVIEAQKWAAFMRI